MSDAAYQIDYDALTAIVAAIPKPIDKTAYVDELFRVKLASALPGYEPRKEQIQMAKMIARGLAEGGHVVAEAGTGIGKSMAYLLPVAHHCLAEHCRAIASTGTIALQEQLHGKDLSLVTELFPDLKYALAKGKSNYVCPLRVRENQGSLFADASGNLLWEWVRSTETGDRSDFPGDSGQDWQKICVDDSCPGAGKCSQGSKCFYAKARARWEEADILICNHTLLCIHLALQLQSCGNAGILPDAQVIVLDEAHHLENEAREAFSTQISSLRLPLLLAQTVKLTPIPQEDLQRARRMNDRFFAAVRVLADNDQAKTVTFFPEAVIDAADELASIVTTIKRFLHSAENERAEALIEKLDNLRGDLCETISHPAAEGTSDNVTWIEVNKYRDTERITLHQNPIEVGGRLRAALWDVYAYPTVIATSATLISGGNFRYFKQQTGCPSGSLELAVDSPFDYYRQCLLYIPNDLPEPKDNPLYYQQIVPRINEILEKTDGRAFVLFTSYRGMNECYDLLSPRLRWQVLKQGDAPKQELIRRFKDEHSVLFGTDSFWEGVDVPGTALSAVIICSLPFAVPTDPVTKAKADAVKARAGNDFMELALPEMILRLKQGFGRLIRTRQDRGMVAILDKRVWTKRYGGEVLRSLPRCRQIGSLENVEAFLAGR